MSDFRLSALADWRLSLRAERIIRVELLRQTAVAQQLEVQLFTYLVLLNSYLNIMRTGVYFRTEATNFSFYADDIGERVQCCRVLSLCSFICRTPLVYLH